MKRKLGNLNEFHGSRGISVFKGGDWSKEDKKGGDIHKRRAKQDRYALEKRISEQIINKKKKTILFFERGGWQRGGDAKRKKGVSRLVGKNKRNGKGAEKLLG